MSFASSEHWDAYYSDNATHVDWLCSYSTLRKLVLGYLNTWAPPLPGILLLGTGLSTFAEELYDSGFQSITVVDFSAAAAEAHRQRAARPPRNGLRVVHRSAVDAEWPELDDAEAGQYGIVVDKGLIDCLLTARDGIDRAAAAIGNVWSRMSTPGVWLSVSHSPPPERRDLYTLTAAVEAGSSQVYWHDLKVKRVRLAPLEYACTTTLPGPEQVEDYVEGAKEAEGANGVTAGGGSGDSGEGFRDDVAYIYLLTK